MTKVRTFNEVELGVNSWKTTQREFMLKGQIWLLDLTLWITGVECELKLNQAVGRYSIMLCCFHAECDSIFVVELDLGNWIHLFGFGFLQKNSCNGLQTSFERDEMCLP